MVTFSDSTGNKVSAQTSKWQMENDQWKMANPGSAFRQTKFGSVTIRVSTLLSVGAPRWFEWYVILKLLLEVMQFLLGRHLQSLQPFGTGCFNFLREPKPFCEIHSNNSYYDDNQKYLAETLEISDQPHDRPTEEIAGTAQKKHPKKTARQ
jgi:hypothetical protein